MCFQSHLQPHSSSVSSDDESSDEDNLTGHSFAATSGEEGHSDDVDGDMVADILYLLFQHHLLSDHSLTPGQNIKSKHPQQIKHMQ
jgi:hypothetical protein